jgi:hypothetical protein
VAGPGVLLDRSSSTAPRNPFAPAVSLETSSMAAWMCAVLSTGLLRRDGGAAENER